MVPLTLDFHYRNVFSGGLPEAYERLLMDCMAGDQTLFIRHDEVEVAWRLLTPVLEAWSRGGRSTVGPYPYPAGGWGPPEADRLLERDGHAWRALELRLPLESSAAKPSPLEEAGAATGPGIREP